MPSKFSHLDLQKYFEYVELVGSLSRLCSDNERPYIDYRTAEMLFCECVYPELQPRNLTREDTSFDATIIQSGKKIGVGVKTFVGQMVKGRYKDEKVAEFTKKSQTGNFNALNDEAVALTVSQWRNEAIRVDAATYNIDVSDCFYHCLIRIPGAVFCHEEPYPTIDVAKIQPTDRNGNLIASFANKTQGTVYFSDGLHCYRYNRSKNVLYKRFYEKSFNNSVEHPVVIAPNPIHLLKNMLTANSMQLLVLNKTRSTDRREVVVLPLSVQAKSGLNQWNAGGRPRKFAEAYIPVPAWINEEYPVFFPKCVLNGKERGQKFELSLPDGSIVSARLCQQNLKALMSDPNEDLLHWLYRIIDGSFEQAEAKRFHPDTGKNIPYTVDDLIRIGSDSVGIIKNSSHSFELELLPLGAYDAFKENFENLGTQATVKDLQDIIDNL